MTILGDGLTRNAIGEINGLDNNGIRFWTLMWDIKRRRGEIDGTTAQHIMSGLHSCDRVSGTMTIDTKGEGRIWGSACNQETVSLSGGTADGKVASLRDVGTEIRWTLGSPSHWRGSWDWFDFHE